MATVGSVSSLITAKTGIGGLASGMDIDSLVLKMTAASRLKVTKQEQSLQLLEWKQTAYRSVTTALTEFRDKYLNSLSATNFKSSSLYNTVKATVGKDVTAFTATATAGVGAGKAYVNKIEQLATSQTITNQASVTNPLEGKEDITSSSLAAFVANKAGHAKDFMVTLDGVSRTVVIDNDFVTELKRLVLTDPGNPGIYTPNPTDEQIALVDLNAVTGADQAAYLQKALQIRVNKLFENPPDSTPTSDEYLAMANPKITVTLYTSSGNGKIEFAARDNSKLTLGYATGLEGVNYEYKKDADGNVIETAAAYKARIELEERIAHLGTGLGALGFADKQSNRIDIYSSLAELRDTGKLTSSMVGAFAPPNPTLSPDGTSSNNYVFIINDVRISVNEDESLYSLMNKINSSQAGVTLSYSEVTDKFTLTAKQQGAGENIVMGDTNGNLLMALGLKNGTYTYTDSNGGQHSITSSNASASYGQNAIAYIDGQKVERTGNEFTVNGVAYSLKETYNETWTPIIDANGTVTNAKTGEAITLSPDATDLVETVKNFVKDYNALVDLLYGVTNEERYSDYEPLTEEERAAMSESQIKAWEDKAKSGLLRSDSTVSKIFSSMRESFLSSVDGFSLFNLGITYGTATDSWKSNGKLTISDETKLKSVLEANSDQVRNFFTNASKGAITKLDKAIDDAVRTTGGQGHRGSLIEMAGLPSTMSETENTIYTQMVTHTKRINALKDQLEKEESRLWAQFTAMEEALAKINEQSSILSQYLGTGSS